MECSWIFPSRINLNRVNPSKCDEPARLKVVNPHYGETAYCFKHLGMALKIAAKYVDTQFTNMNGDKIEAI